MSDKFCCVTWNELSPELIQAKSDEIEQLLKDSKLPRSVFASVIRVLNNMTNYCPVCGSCLNPELLVKVNPVKKQAALREIEEQTQEVPIAQAIKKRCAACGSRGILGRDKQGVDIRCMKCHGTGWFENKHIAEDPNAKRGQSKVDGVREAMGIGDNPITVEDKE